MPATVAVSCDEPLAVAGGLNTTTTRVVFAFCRAFFLPGTTKDREDGLGRAAMLLEEKVTKTV